VRKVVNWVGVKNYLTDFERKKTFKEKIAIIFALFLLDWLCFFLILFFLNGIFGQEKIQKYAFWGWIKGNYSLYGTMHEALKNNLGASVFFAVFLAPFWEELVFRCFMLWKKWRKRVKESFLQPDVVNKFGKVPIWDYCVFSSIIFGLGHGGPIHIMIQGVGGMFLCYAFLACNRSWFWSALLHGMWNASVILSVYIGSEKALMNITFPWWLPFMQ